MGKTATAAKIESFAALPAGWHYGSGAPIALDTIQTSKSLLDVLLLNGLTRTDAFPGSDGEILVAGYFDDHYVALTVNASATIDVSYEQAGKEIDEREGLNFVESKKWIADIARGIWNLSGSSTLVHSTTTGASLVTSPSKTLPAMGACQYSSENVARLQVA